MIYFRMLLTATVTLSFFAIGSTLHSGTAAARPQKWQLIWSDEFDYAGKPDAKKWIIETKEGQWGNGETQEYTDSINNSRVENGNLIIEARKEADGRMTSARMHTAKPFKYGRFEARAKFPSGNGVWPAIWMMADKHIYGDALWPDNGELDIVEHVGREPDQILGCVYTKNFNWMNGNGITKFLNIPGTESEFHVYAVEWDAEWIKISVDGLVFNVYKNPHTNWGDWPFDQPFNVILNVALDSFGGDVDPNIFPQQMQVDYVRIYQEADQIAAQ